MPRAIKIGITVVAIVAVLPIVVIIVLFVGMSQFSEAPTVRREIQLANHGSLVIDGKRWGRSEHGFSQRAGYRPPGSTKIEWFGDVSDGVEPQVYQAGPLIVVIDLPGAQLFVRSHVIHTETQKAPDTGKVNPPNLVRPAADKNWKTLVLIFPNDLGPFPISYYAEQNGLTLEEVSRINELGGKRDR